MQTDEAGDLDDLLINRGPGEKPGKGSMRIGAKPTTEKALPTGGRK